MKYFWMARAVKGIVIVATLIAALSWLVMSLWNCVLPGLFGWPSLNFVQALGLLILCRILFGGLRGPGMHWRQHMHERWQQMSPEEREKLRAGLRGRCGPWDSSNRD